MKALLLALMALFCVSVFAQSSYEIPGSSVVELPDPDSNRVYPVFIKLPPSWRSNPKSKYPVVYLTDAPYSFPLTYGATRFPMNSGAMQEVIIVAVSWAKGDRGQVSRVRDYTPAKASTWEMITGGGAAHAKFFQQVLFPHIEKHYRGDAQNRTYVGNSLGGLFGAWLLLQQPELFKNYVLGSPSVWFYDNYLLSLKPKNITNPTKVFIAVGDLETPEFGEGQDMVAGAKALVMKISALKNANIELKFRLIEDAQHETAFPTTAIQGLHWIHGISKF